MADRKANLKKFLDFTWAPKTLHLDVSDRVYVENLPPNTRKPSAGRFVHGNGFTLLNVKRHEDRQLDRARRIDELERFSWDDPEMLDYHITIPRNARTYSQILVM